MAFDKPTRNRLAKFVADARGVIADEFTEQFQSLYGISAKGDIASLDKLGHLDEAGTATAALLRERIDYLEKTHPDDKDGTRAAVARLAREQAFTILNRLAAIRMAEMRGLIVESVGKGYQSKGFKVFETVAGSALGDTYHRYRRYLYCLFDELAIDLGALFDRRSPQALLFPREPALLALLDLLHAADLEPLWAEDETIGWIYQYYNDPEERKKMRAESAAPRNSRELAVRNQFFTPRYVVEFLTDNTLGRIWYEMTEGRTRLAEQCRYLVRRPTEILLKPADEFLFDGCRDWVREVRSGNFAAAVEDATWDEISSVALAIDGYVAAEKLGIPDVNNHVRPRWDVAENESKVDDAPLLDQWLLLFCVQRGILREQYQEGNEKLQAAVRAVWNAWVRAAKGESTSATREALSQEELLRQPVLIPPRPLKDPREIRLLDPACGSMHFGLYAFDLFETIYEEAWDSGSYRDLQEGYASKDEFLKDVPRLIIEHNIHGIDIDPRATQIAALSLWLRAQKAWQQQKVPAADRPRVRRSNIVCAEPMPGSPEMLEEFVATLKPDLLGELVKTVFDKMQLAGEAGALLKIEEEIRTAIDTARKEWLKQQDDLLTRKDGSQEEFFDTAEQQVIDALRAYAEQADADSYQRRLFADDAARGFAFIDLCHKRYDAVVMNPPFGESSVDSDAEMRKRWGSVANDIFAMFIADGTRRLEEAGLLGAITSRNFLVGRDQRDFRPMILGQSLGLLEHFVDLGLGILDAAEVETCTYTVRKGLSAPSSVISFHDFRATPRSEIDDFFSLIQSSIPILRSPKTYLAIENCPIVYAANQTQISELGTSNSLEPAFGRVTRGLNSSDDERFLRLMWEPQVGNIGSRWRFCAKGSDYSWFITNIATVIDWHRDGGLIEAHTANVSDNVAQARRSSTYYFLPGATYTYRCNDFSLRALPEGCIFTNSAPVIIPASRSDLVGLFSAFFSRKYDGLLSLISKKGKYDTGRMKLLPSPPPTCNSEEQNQSWSRLLDYIFGFERNIEESPYFLLPSLPDSEPFDPSTFEELVRPFVASSGLDLSESFLVRSQRWLSERFPDQLAKGQDLSSYFVGTAFGRWDIRYASGECQPPELPDPFDPLPVCPPGMLQNAEGLPAEPKDVSAAYPLRISWSGILVDDENHPEDIVASVREAIEVIWKDRAEAIEQEACGILGVKTLRDYFRRPAAFFADHLKRYSKSRRQAPIYWPLSTKSGSYTLWLYYHRLTDQTLHTCLADFLDPKLRKVQSELDALTASGGGGTRAGELREFLDELHDLRDEIERVIKLPWKPNLNDGVLITASPLHKLFRLPKWQKDLKACWDKLAKGEYDWAHLAHTIWPSRVEKACEKDRSIAIAHGLEHLCKVQAPKAKKKRAKKSEAEEPEEDDPQLIEED